MVVIYRQFAVVVCCTHILTTSITGLMKICSTRSERRGRNHSEDSTHDREGRHHSNA